jgi:predicted TIM-barrel enzyme
VIGAAVRQAFPQLHLGICLLGHSAREPLAIAQAIGAQSVRLKVYVGAMVKADGVLEGLAYEAIHYRREIGAEDIAILADVYDRTGEPLGRMPLEEEARQAALFGRADALVLTGHSFAETQEMVAQVRRAKLEKPLFIGGGVDAKNVRQALASADGVIISSAFKPIAGWSRQSLLSDWDSGKMVEIMQQVNGR